MLAALLLIVLAPEEPAALAVRRVAEGIIAADNNRDIEGVLSFYATDAVLLPPNEPPLSGHAAIRPRYEALFAGFTPAIEGRIDQLIVDGVSAVVRGHNCGRLTSRGSAPSRALDDVYLMLLRREADGSWRISHLMWHRASPAGAEARCRQ